MFFKTKAQPTVILKDELGRDIIPRGFVVVTEDKMGMVSYTAEDYNRMVIMGANFQVIKLNLAKLGGWEGYPFEESYMKKIDSLVNLGRQAGMKTFFKMVVYSVPEFDMTGWKKLWENKNGEQERWIGAWQRIWERYKDDPSVFGYDLLNEPKKGNLNLSYDTVEEDYLVPFLRKMIDASQKINPDKKCLYQPLLVNDDDRMKYPVPFFEMKISIERKNIIYAPHIYESTINRIKPTIKRYIHEAGISGAGLFIGEWGPPTFRENDTSLTDQNRIKKVYIANANVFDAFGVGTIKAWFRGSRDQDKNNTKAFTYAIFSDDRPVGVVERKYITDVISRPYPQTVAGTINRFSFDFLTRIFSMDLIPDNSKGTSTLYIPAERYYPDGFSIHLNDDLVVRFNPLKNSRLEVINSPKEYNTANIIWDPTNRHLIITQWPNDKMKSTIKIVPGY